MLHNLIVISLRSLGKRKFYSILNISGLAVSIAFSFLLILYVNDQESYDRHFINADRIYRVNAILDMGGKRDVYSNAPRPAAPMLKSEFPEILESTRISGLSGLELHTAILEFEGKRIRSNQIFMADASIFKIFERDFVTGDPDKALAEPNSIVISESLAKKIYGTSDVIGKSLQIPEDGKYVKVTGVMKDADFKSHLPAEALVSGSTYRYFSDKDMDNWYGGHVYTYVLLEENSSANALQEKYPAFFKKYMKQTFDRFNGKAEFKFQPLLTIHLGEEYTWEAYPHGSQSNVKALNIVAWLLLVFAIINYINLATARASERAAEVGIRKTLGSSRRWLLAQFLSESTILSLISGAMALVLSALLLPYFNQLADVNVDIWFLLSFKNVITVLVLSVAIGLLAGIYPAVYLSSLESVKILKGKFNGGGSGDILRKILVASQYFIAATLIASILFVSEQTKFIQSKDIGFDKNNLLTVIIPGDSIALLHVEAFKQKLKTGGHIVNATSTYYSMDKEANHFSPILENEDGTRFQTGSDLIQVDDQFMATMGTELVAGRNFSQADEPYEVIINEAAARKFGWDKNPLGGKFASWTQMDTVIIHNVVGVVKDFNLGVSYHNVGPLIIFLSRDGGGNLYVRTEKNATREAIEDIKQSWQEFFPGHPLEYSFLDQSLGALYNKEERFLNLLSSFSVVIVFIACLGIIGLISFTTVLRKKEIAIRKVLGSPLKSIIALLANKFIILLFVANIVALPITYYLIAEWLNHYAYRIQIGVWPFVISLTVSIFFTSISLLYHTASAAFENPVKALRSE